MVTPSYSTRPSIKDTFINNESNEAANLSELSQVKESDILNDEDTENMLSEAVSLILNKNTHSQLNYSLNQVKYQTMVKSSPSNSYTAHNYSLKQPKSNDMQRRVSLKKRNLSASSTLIDQMQQNNPSINNSNNNMNNFNENKLINFENLLNNKHQLKMHHIEDALASVLDDMKQLDFSTSLSITPPPVSSNQISSTVKPKQVTNSLSKTAINNLMSSLSSSKASSSVSSSSSSSTSSSNSSTQQQQQQRQSCSDEELNKLKTPFDQLN
jgi:hypothetical protein